MGQQCLKLCRGSEEEQVQEDGDVAAVGAEGGAVRRGGAKRVSLGMRVKGRGGSVKDGPDIPLDRIDAMERRKRGGRPRSSSQRPSDESTSEAGIIVDA